MVHYFPKTGIDVLLGLESFEVINPFVTKREKNSMPLLAEHVKDLGVHYADRDMERNGSLEENNPCGPRHTDVMGEYITPDLETDCTLVLAVTRSNAAREMARLAEVDREMEQLTPKVTLIGGDRLIPVVKPGTDNIEKRLSVDSPRVITMFGITTEDLIREQRADSTLEAVRGMAAKHKEDGVTNYFFQEEVLCGGTACNGTYENGNGRTCYRRRLMQLAHDKIGRAHV